MDRKINSCSFKNREGSYVTTRGFQAPVTVAKLPKLYILKYQSKIAYVGITKRSVSSRLHGGFNAKGKHGYYGYKWKDFEGKIDMLIWCFPNKELDYVESIEAEVVFAIRQHTGQWPYAQSEIHFHNVKQEEKNIAAAIYNEAIKAA